MKYLYLNIVLLFTLHLSAQIPVFPQDSAVWQAEYSTDGLYPHFIACSFHQSGDTLIGPEMYQKIYVKYEDDPPELFAASRTQGNIVYVIKLVQEIPCGGLTFMDVGLEYVLYDFNLTVSDTMLTGIQLEAVCTLVDSVTIDNALLKRMYMSGRIGNSGLFDDEWIFGIGSIRGPLWAHAPSMDFYARLLCFQSDDFEYFHPQYGSACVVSNKNILSNHALSIYPNPIISGGFLTVEASDFSAVYNWELFTAQGHSVEFGVVQEQRVSIGSPLAPGIYILHLKDDRGHIHTTKLVVQ